VYATDRSGRLLVLDRRHGRELSSYDVRDYVVILDNQWTDRIYLAAHDGRFICLHDRDYATPVASRKVEEKVPAPLPGKKPLPKPPSGKPPKDGGDEMDKEMKK
jgi:hypothetical protein